MLKDRHLIEPSDFSPEELDGLFALAQRIEENQADYYGTCKGKILASLFFEPSTRTRLSFEAAMLRLGGSVLGFAEAGSSSAAKGESLADTVRTVSCYADLLVIRNPKEGSAKLAQHYAKSPVINAGDGGHHHPTQTLTDLFTIKQIHKRLDNLTVGFCGDLKFGRTVHSLAASLSRYPGINMVFISPQELRIPAYIASNILESTGVPYRETEKLEDAIGALDVLYMTRVQRERFFNEEDYIRLKDRYILTPEKMTLAPKEMIVLHPLPRVNEIAVEVDRDKRAVYFEQTRYGMLIRMALISAVLGTAE
jgi:aspartate carbamoyltransferase catalytic subunit